VYTELAESMANTEPQIIAKTDLRYGYFLVHSIFSFITISSSILFDILVRIFNLLSGVMDLIETSTSFLLVWV
jgi:hypothetical protein